MTGSTITVTRRINADSERVWTAMTDTDLVSEWMMGARVRSDWQPGSVDAAGSLMDILNK